MPDDDQERARAYTVGIAGGPYDGPEQAIYYGVYFVNERRRDQERNAHTAARRAEEYRIAVAHNRRVDAWVVDVREEQKGIIPPRLMDFGEESPAFCRAIEEYRAQILEARVRVTKKHRIVGFETAVAEMELDIRELRKPEESPPTHFATTEEAIAFEVRTKTRNIPRYDLLFLGTSFGGDLTQWENDKRVYAERVRKLRIGVYGQHGVPLPEVVAASQERRRRRIRIGLAVVIGLAAAAGAAKWAWGNEVRPGRPDSSMPGARYTAPAPAPHAFDP
jgi:hypothetical protein